MKRQYSLKFDKQVEAITGWGKMYYCFDDLDRYDSQMLLNYLIDTEPTWRRSSSDEGYEDYYECTNPYITERLGYISNEILKWMFEDLEKHQYVFIHHSHNNSKGKRYVKLNYSKIKFALGIEEGDEQGTESSTDSCTESRTEQGNESRNEWRTEQGNESRTKKFSTKQNNIITEYQNNIFQENSKSTNTQNNTQSNPQDNTEFLCISKKEDPAIEYIKTTKHSESLMDWYLENKNKVTLEKLKKQYDDICKQCKNNYNMIDRAIKNAYYGNYLIFMVPTNNNYQKQNLFTSSVTTDITNPNRTLGYKVSYPC